MNKIFLVVLTLVLLGSGLWFLFKETRTTSLRSIISFEACVDSGGLVIETFPRQCQLSDGRSFFEEVFGEPGFNENTVSEYPEENARVVEGVVVAVRLDAIAYDGPGFIDIETNGGGIATIAVPSMGLPSCAAKDNMISVYDISVGDSIQASGLPGPEGQIVPCESVEHYLRVKE